MTHPDPRREQELREMIASSSGNVRHHIELAELLQKCGRSEESLAILADASNLKLSEVHRGLLLNEQAQLLAQMTTRKLEALSLAEQAISILSQQPTTIEIQLAETNAQRLAAELLWESDRSRAAELTARAISTIKNATGTQVDPDNLSMLYWTASRLYALTGDLGSAIEWIQRALAQPLTEDEKVAPLIDLGQLLRQSGRMEEAKEAFQEALRSIFRESRRENPRLYHELGLIERSLGHLEVAKVHFEKALEIVNSDSLLRSDLDYIKTLYLEIAEACYERGDYRAEAQTYRDILAILPELDPAYWTFRLSLTRSCVALGRLDEAREALGEIVRRASDKIRNAAKADLLSLRYTVALRDYEAGKLDSSIGECEALLREPDTDETLRADLLLLLGHANAGLKRYERARTFYSTLISSSSTPEYQRNAAKESISRLPVGREN